MCGQTGWYRWGESVDRLGGIGGERVDRLCSIGWESVDRLGGIGAESVCTDWVV